MRLARPGPRDAALLYDVSHVFRRRRPRGQKPPFIPQQRTREKNAVTVEIPRAPARPSAVCSDNADREVPRASARAAVWEDHTKVVRLFLDADGLRYGSRPTIPAR